MQATAARASDRVLLSLTPETARYVANAMIDAMNNEDTDQGFAKAQHVLYAIETIIGPQGIEFVR